MKKINDRPKRDFKSPFDVHRCFHIGDFRVSDSIAVRRKDGSRVYGTVTGVDLKNVTIAYETEDEPENEAGINDIVYLGDSNSRTPVKHKREKESL